MTISSNSYPFLMYSSQHSHWRWSSVRE